ncbi:hypothetical protein AB0K92_15775 [Streptomyces sp. NPDC052687]|uniref:hypothetical protein n=1 Tax=Streptomyces sp. NPDC052687 TaxID=3154759 RepID=UPI0034231B8A
MPRRAPALFGRPTRVEPGHRLRFVIAASDGAYFGNRGVKPVTVVSVPHDTGAPHLPVTGG